MKKISQALTLKIYNPDTSDRALAFGALGFCEAYMEGWWDEENDNIVELIGLFYRSNVYSKANQRVTIPLLIKIITQRLQIFPLTSKIIIKSPASLQCRNNFCQIFSIQQ